jgi:hypothetical protein
MAKQKRIAKSIVRMHPLVTEIKGAEIIIRKNLLYDGNKGDTNNSFRTIKVIIFFIVALLTHLIFEVFLRNLEK